MSAEKVRNLETMFHTLTIKLVGALNRICNQSAFNNRAAEITDKKFALAVSNPAKLSKRRKSFRNKTFIFSCQTRFFLFVFGFSFEFKVSSSRFKVLLWQINFEPWTWNFELLNYCYTVNLDPRITRQTRRLDGCPRRFILAEKLRVNFIHRRKIIHIRQEYGCFDDVVQISSSRF